MGDSSTVISPKAAESASESSKDTLERAQLSQRSYSDSATSMSTGIFNASHASSSSTKEDAPLEEAEEEEAITDEEEFNPKDEPEEEKEEPKPTMKKRHSSSDHANLYTECGRHGDDWLFGGISGAVKSVFGKPEKK